MIARKVIFLDSSQATTKNLNQGLAVFEYPQPIEPFGQSVKVALVNFSYTNFFLNIEPPNNVIYYSDDALLPQKYTITIPTGSWSLSDLNDYIISTQLAEVVVAQQIFSLTPNYSTGKVSITFGNVTGWFVNFTATAPPILGFGVQHVPVTDSNTAYYTEEAPNTASFNTITQVKVATDLVQDSIDNSALSSNILHISTPTVGPGSVQKDEPTTILTIESHKLTTKVSSITLQCIDQLNRPIVMAEDFSVCLIVL